MEISSFLLANLAVTCRHKIKRSIAGRLLRMDALSMARWIVL